MYLIERKVCANKLNSELFILSTLCRVNILNKGSRHKQTENIAQLLNLFSLFWWIWLNVCEARQFDQINGMSVIYMKFIEFNKLIDRIILRWNVKHSSVQPEMEAQKRNRSEMGTPTPIAWVTEFTVVWGKLNIQFNSLLY